MANCVVCSRALPSFITISAVRINASRESFIETITSFPSVSKENEGVLLEILRSLYPARNNILYVHDEAGNLYSCNGCLREKGLVDAARVKAFESYLSHEYPVEEFKRGELSCGSCGKRSGPDCNVSWHSTCYGVFKSLDEFMMINPPERKEFQLRRVVKLVTGYLSEPAVGWIVLHIPGYNLILCEECSALAQREKYYVNYSQELIDVSSIVPQTPLNVINPPEAYVCPQIHNPSSILPPYVLSSYNYIQMGNINETLWKILLQHEGVQGPMYYWSKKHIVHLDWKKKKTPDDVRTNDQIQNDVIVERLEKLLNPADVPNTENRYARYLLECVPFDRSYSMVGKLCCLFQNLLNLYVTQHTFSAFRAVYVGLWNLFPLDAYQKKSIAKQTLKYLGHMAYRMPIFQFLMNNVNLLSLYKHESMFREPNVREQIYFHNYKFLRHLSEMNTLEKSMDNLCVKCQAPTKKRHVSVSKKEKPACARELFPSGSRKHVPIVRNGKPACARELFPTKEEEKQEEVAEKEEEKVVIQDVDSGVEEEVEVVVSDGQYTYVLQEVVEEEEVVDAEEGDEVDI